MKTSQLAMPVGTTDPVHQYRRQLRPSLAEQIEIVPLEADDRTPAVDRRLAAIDESLQKRQKQMEAERTAMRELETDYADVLLTDRQKASQLKAQILTGADVLETLARESAAEEQQRQQLISEKDQIARERAATRQSNEISEEINSKKRRAEEILNYMIEELPELRDCYRQLRERSYDETLPENERARLGKAADQIEGVFREFVVFQLDGSQRTAASDFLRRWVNLPVL